jgi:hypothetical protein
LYQCCICGFLGKAWEDVKRETTKALKNVTIQIDGKKEFNGDGEVKTKVEINL